MAAANPSKPPEPGLQPPPSSQSQQQPQQRNEDCEGDLAHLIQRLGGSVPPGPVDAALSTLMEKFPNEFKELSMIKAKVECVQNLSSDDSALKMKIQANSEYESKNFDVSGLLYTRAMALCHTDDLLAALCNNRSTVLFQQGRFVESLADATEANKYRPGYWKAMARRASCLEQLGRSELAQRDRFACEKEEESQLVSYDEIRALFYRSPAHVFPAIPKATVLDGAMAFEFSDQKGRHVVAQKQLSPGTTLLEETPFAWAPSFESMLTACAFCLKRTGLLYPGREYRQAGKRSRGLFCSDECASKHWTTFGEDESKNPFFLLCPTNTLLAYRCSRCTIDAIEHNLSPAAFPSKVGPLHPLHPKLGREHIESLVAFSKELFSHSEVGGYESVLSALALFFGALDVEGAEKLRRYHRKVIVNSFFVQCNDRVASSATARQHSVITLKLGKGIYSVASMFNHSCDPNCFITFEGNPFSCTSGKLNVRVVRTVMEGEELSVCYNNNVHKNKIHSTRARIRALRGQYGFGCSCGACFGNLDEPVPKEEEEHYFKAADYFQKGKRLMREHKLNESVEVLSQSLEIVFRYICPPPKPPMLMVAKTHDALAQAYLLLGNEQKCVEHLEMSLDVQKLHHGEDDIQLIQEYTKMAALRKEKDEGKKYAKKAEELLRLYYPPSKALESEVELLNEVA